MSLSPEFSGYDSRLGLEDFSRRMYVRIFEEINEALDAEAARWAYPDVEFNAFMARPGVNASLEHFRAETMHIGHRPSMIEAPVANYPSMAIMASRALPQPDQNDQSETSQIFLSVEAIVRSGPFAQGDTQGDGETAVNRRANRTAEAINTVVMSSREIAGFTSPDRAPTVIIGDVWERDEETSTGPRWYFQGIRLEYLFKKMSVYGNLDIDQPN